MALLGLEVEAQAAFVAMQVLEIEAVPFPPHSVDVAVAWRLDLDHVGAPVGELAYGSRAGTVGGEIEHFDAGKR